MADKIWLKDPQGVYLACNPRFESFFGASVSEIVGNTDYDFLSPDKADCFRNMDQAALEVGGSRMNEEEISLADGSCIYLETTKTPMYDTAGKLLGVLGIAHDITQRKHSKDALRESEERYRLTLDSMLEGCQVISPNFRNYTSTRLRPGMGIGNSMSSMVRRCRNAILASSIRSCSI